MRLASLANAAIAAEHNRLRASHPEWPAHRATGAVTAAARACEIDPKHLHGIARGDRRHPASARVIEALARLAGYEARRERGAWIVRGPEGDEPLTA